MRHVCNTSEGDRRHLIMMLPARFAETSYLRRFLPLENSPHQGIAQRVPDNDPDASRATVTDVDRQHIRRKPVLGGLINEYRHAA
jgi:hypothetical protein